MDKTQYRFVSIKICENMKNERKMGKNGSTIAGAHDIKNKRLVTYMVRVPYQGAFILQVWGLCDLPFENFAPAIIFVMVHAVAPGTCHVARGAT